MMNVIIQEKLHDAGLRGRAHRKLRGPQRNGGQIYPGICGKDQRRPRRATCAEAARLYAKAKAGSIVYCMGITQHTVGTDNVKTLANLAMLCGNVGIDAGGVNPLRGQNNVQGACDMGGLPNVFSGYQPVTDANNRKKMEAAWGVKNLPDWVGMTMTDMLPAIAEGKIKALYIIGENPVISDPDSDHAGQGHEAAGFPGGAGHLPDRDRANWPTWSCPAASFAEKDGTFTNTERRVARVRQAIPPLGESRPDWQIICGNFHPPGLPHELCQPRRRSSRRFASSPPPMPASPISAWRPAACNGPAPPTEHPGTVYLAQGPLCPGQGDLLRHRPQGSGGDARRRVPPVSHHRPAPLSVSYRHHEPPGPRAWTEKAPECQVEIAAADAANYGIADGDQVRVRTRRGEITAKAQISPKAVPGTVFIPFHFAEAAANKLTNAALDPVSKIPEYKVCAVQIEKADPLRRLTMTHQSWPQRQSADR